MSSRKFADKMMPFLEKHNKYTEKDKIIAHYGLETLYIFFEKLIIITVISMMIGITKELYLLFLLFWMLRLYAGGMHLSSSLGCTILSTILFIGGTYLCMHMHLELSYRIIIAGVSICIFTLYSPADTYKKPLIRENIRLKRKIKSIIVVLIYFISLIIIKNNFILNVITYSIFVQSLLICPCTYKIFNQPYNNYIVYGNYKRKEE